MGNGSNCGSLLSLPDHRKIYSLLLFKISDLLYTKPATSCMLEATVAQLVQQRQA